MLKRSTTINEQARATLSITRDEYALCSYIHYRSADSRQKVRGMCCDPKQDIAEFVGVSRRGIYKFIDRMEAKGLLSADPVTGYLSTTAKWVIVENSENKVHKDKNEECEQSSQKVRTKFTKSVNKVPRNIEVKEDKYDKSECVTDLASLDQQAPTHTPVPAFSSPVEEKEKKDTVSPAAAPADPQPPSFYSSPNATTPEALFQAIGEFYKKNPEMWRAGILDMGRGSRYPAERQVEITKDWCCYMIQKNQGKNTYTQLNASLQTWFRNEQFMNWKNKAAAAGPSNSNDTRYTPPPPNTITPAYIP